VLRVPPRNPEPALDQSPHAGSSRAQRPSPRYCRATAAGSESGRRTGRAGVESGRRIGRGRAEAGRRTITTGGESGQASVELVAVLPLVVLAGVVAWQLVLAGHTLWLSAGAARTAARADTVGRSAEGAARSALPDSLERGLAVERLRQGGVRVSVPVPLLLRRWRGPVRVSATSSLGRAK
jgi:hypothetical protein